MMIDSHVHISYLRKKRDLSVVKDDLILNMKKNKIDFSLVIPDNNPNPQCADLDTVLKLIKNEKKLYAIGTLKVEAVNRNSLAEIDNLFSKKLIKGFKIFPGHDPVYPTDERWLPIYKLCLKHDLPLIVHTGINSNNPAAAEYNDPKYIIKIAKIYPKLKIIIAHYFWPKLDYCFKITEGFKNIYFDTSALADFEVIKASGGIEKIKTILEKTARRKADSVIFGTDWPIGNVKKHINLINSLNIAREEKENIFFKNAKKIFRLN